MELTDILGLLVPVMYFVFLLAERRWPARQFPEQRGWPWLGIGFLILAGTISVVVPLLIPDEWLSAHRWLDGTRLGVAGGTLVGFVLLEGAIYFLHRAAHTFEFLWRGYHQVHQGPQRVAVPGSVRFHAVEMLVQVAAQLLVTVIVLGLEPLAAAIIGYLLAFVGMFQHGNVRTPQWVGYLAQRPESHCVHHRLGLHDYNFSDLPIWDMRFGTFRNPRQFMDECGFEGGAARKLGAMLAFADVNARLYGSGNRGKNLECDPSRRPEVEHKALWRRSIAAAAAVTRPGQRDDAGLSVCAPGRDGYCRPNTPLLGWPRRSANRGSRRRAPGRCGRARMKAPRFRSR